MKLTKLLLVLTSFGALVVGYESEVQAGKTANQSFKVTATVVPGCTLALATIAFGNYDPITGTDGTASATWTVKCTIGAAIRIAIGNGSHSVNATTNGMTLGGSLTPGLDEKLIYTLTNESGTPWNNAELAIPNGTGADQDVVVKGAMAAGQNVKVGAYEDSVVATVNW